jgi:hypothetical protein
MNNWCICWFFTHIFTGILIFKGLTARCFYKSFGVKGLITGFHEHGNGHLICPTKREIGKVSERLIVAEQYFASWRYLFGYFFRHSVRPTFTSVLSESHI